jgi:hypothetical protein
MEAHLASDRPSAISSMTRWQKPGRYDVGRPHGWQTERFLEIRFISEMISDFTGIEKEF